MKNTRYICLVIWCLTSVLWANTFIWDVSTLEDLQKGSFENTILTASGEVRLGTPKKEVACEQETIWSHLVDENGQVYFGTGMGGKVGVIRDEKLEDYFDTGEIMVTAMTHYQGAIYAATIPEGKIFRIVDGEGEVFCQLPSAYIWSMVEHEGGLYVATGPAGRLYRVDLEIKQSEVALQTPEKHLLSLTKDPEGNLYVGSSPSGIVYKISQGKSRVIVDFPENEIRSLCFAHDKLFIGANVSRNFDNAQMVDTLAKQLQQRKYHSTNRSRKKLLERMMDGRIYAYDDSNGWKELLHLNKDFVTAMAPAKEGVYLGTGLEGKVYQVVDEFQHTLTSDLKEDQIMTIATNNGKISHIGTGDGGKIYESLTADTSLSYYLSEVFDAETFSHWSKAFWKYTGRLSLEFRSGNSRYPDEFWSQWSPGLNTNPVRINVPPGRYFQYRAHWLEESAVLRSVQVLYRPQNRPPVIKHFKINLNQDPKRKIFNAKNSKEIKLNWRAEDPEKNDLRYHLWYRNLESPRWFDAMAGEVYQKTMFTWKTGQLPDGMYELRFDVSDSLENVKPAVASKKIRAFVIDNNAPSVNAQIDGEKVRGVVNDSFSFITQVGYRVNKGEWTLIESEDGIYDDAQEIFTFDLPKNLGVGSILEIRALDTAGNMGYDYLYIK